ncbi:MAG: hypothetical protein A3C61_00540 [Candidatus Yanofskybacteria bacterium RIFCSPHIGHO2_02_FULL_39_10]|uniref:DUF5666 domain-containing protein n=1 Tax=Candidatus Yanofskybacteria bacterium RIFCSPHIGHO2_02_FULL_39_10 TaxID=1802674 RepID=A0A1F8F6D4_9BACT|nr:MAG: hypothetical protein A3C61_00540 [Candidatus Yanofskybacteria bacterium RIFCSPHIGHO2_02_FULL_39_10]
MKKIIIILVVLAAASVVFLVFSNLKNSNDSSQNEASVSPETKLPSFVRGEVIKVEGDKIYLKISGEEKIIKTTQDTEIIKQVYIESRIMLKDVTLSDIKELSDVVVYYKNNSGNEYDADKIQILSE